MYESNAPEIIKYLTEDDLKLMYGRLNRRFVVVDALPAVSSLEPADKNVIYVVKETDGGVERYWPNVLEGNVWKPVGIVQEDLNGKIDKVSAEEGHLVVADENGNLTDAGLMPGTFVALAYDPSEQIQPHATDFRKIWGALQSGIPVILLDNRESGTGLYASLNAAGYTWPDGDHMAERVTDVDTDYRPHDDSIPGYYDSENGKFYYDIYHAIEIDPVDGVMYHDLVDDKVYLYADEAFTRVLRFVQFSANELVNDDPVWASRKAARPVFFRIFEPETSATANNFYVAYGEYTTMIKVNVDPEIMYGNGVEEPIGVYEYNGETAGLVPDAPDSDTDKKFLRADGQWETITIPEQVQSDWAQTDDTAPDFIKNKPGLYRGATDEHPGSSGFVPAALSNERDLFLKGDGTWGKPDNAPGDGKLYIALGNDRPTDTGFSANAANDTIVSIPDAVSATEQEAAHGGLMTTADKTKLDEIDLGITPGTGTESDKVNIQLKNNVSADVLTAHQDISGKADKVTGATGGNFAGLDANGNLVDSGEKATNFASTEQGNKADSAVQSVKMGSSSGTELKDGINVIIPEATQNTTGVMSTSDKTKLDGIEEGANAYTHPSHTAHNSGMYKVTIDAQGHVSSVAPIEKTDITALGIPAQDTTYQFADDYNGTTNKGATEATVRNAVSNAINALDRTEDSTGGTNIEIQIVEENGLITEIKVVTDNTVNATDVNTAIETALANYGGFKVVELTSETPPVPDVQNPSEKYIYLTKDSQSSARDPYTEWIYIKGDASADPPTVSHWEVIGVTSIDLSNYIQKVSGATENNFAAFTSDGAIQDSGKNASSFATAAQGTKADNSVQSVSINNGTGIIPDNNGNVNLPLASTTDPGAMSASDKAKLDGIPEILNTGTPGQILTKTASGNEWADAPKELPTSGSAGQFLKKTANGVEYASVSEVPSGGTTGDVLTKTENGVAWETPSGGGEPVDAYTEAETDELLGDKASKSEMFVTPGTGADDDKTTIQLKTGTSATVLTKHQDVSSMLGKSEFGGTILDTSGEPITDNTGDAIQDETMVELYDSFETIKFGAERARADASGHDIETTYATKSELNALLTSIESKLAEI